MIQINNRKRLQFEKEVLGFYLSNHPVTVYEKWFNQLNAVPLHDYAAQTGFKRSIVYISECKKIRTKKGEQMAFLTVSDQSGEMEVVVFPNVLKNHTSILQEGKIILLHSKLEEREGKFQLIMKIGQDVEAAVKLLS